MSAALYKSIYLEAGGKLAIRDICETYTPEGSQCLVRVLYSGVNPCDQNFAHVGLHSCVTGFEFSGIVEQPGPLSRFKVGDNVCGLTQICLPKPSSTGTHQDLCIADADVLYAMPRGLEPKDAGGVVMASHTAADGLFNGLGFGLQAAGVSGPDPKDRAILIWGGASSVGVVAIQMAKAAGFSPIFVTASPQNHATLESLGADQCFDYKSPTVVEDIRAAAKAQAVTLTVAFDTVCKDSMAQGEAVLHSTPGLARSALSSDTSPSEIKLVGTLPVPAIPEFQSCAAYRPPGDHGSLGNPQDPETPVRLRQAVEYFLDSAWTRVKLPVVKVVKGASAGVDEIERVARGDASLEKVVIEHPL
ncbi:GroES-like protein [Nemania abortiva]|nr:GroES-like protein [Nemania abortiva]